MRFDIIIAINRNIIKEFLNIQITLRIIKYATKILIKKKLIFVITILNTIFIKRRFRFLLLKNEIIMLNNKREIIALINIDNKKKTIS